MLIIRRKIGERVVVVSPEGKRLVVRIEQQTEGGSYNISFDGDREVFRIYRIEKEPAPVVPAEAATGSEEDGCEAELSS